MAMTLVFVDCEAVGPCPSQGRLTEFGAVLYRPGTEWHKATYHGIVVRTRPGATNPAIPEIAETLDQTQFFVRLCEAFIPFHSWLLRHAAPHPVAISDNPAFDWQWLNDGFWRTCQENPFGFSARRIGDFYAGLRGDFTKANHWKRLRVTRHDHNPAHDALGNLEAFERMLAGER